MYPQKFDTIIVGSGTSAYYAARRLSAGGQKVAVVDKRAYGGTCALRGCQPKKYLVANAEAIAGARHLVGHGIEAAPRTDWAALQALKNEFLDGIPEDSFNGYRKAGITPLRGDARMANENTIQIGNSHFEADHIILATGSSSRRSYLPGGDLAGTSDTFLELLELPRRIIFIGGGYIAFEFATVAAYAGSQVTILDRNKRPLPAFDPDAVQVLLEATKDTGIRFVPDEEPLAIEKNGNGLEVQGRSGTTYLADAVFETTGRTPNLEVLDGDAHGVESTLKGITVTPYLQSTSNPHVYAIGDVANTGFQLATVADQAGMIAAENILKGNTVTLDTSVVASAVFAIPNLARVGLSEADARQRKLDFRIHRGSTTDWPSSLRIGERHSFYKIIIENSTDRILGAHLLRHQAAEVINIFALALQQGLTVQDLKSVFWAYPTNSSDLNNMLR